MSICCICHFQPALFSQSLLNSIPVDSSLVHSLLLLPSFPFPPLPSFLLSCFFPHGLSTHWPLLLTLSNECVLLSLLLSRPTSKLLGLMHSLHPPRKPPPATLCPLPLALLSFCAICFYYCTYYIMRQFFLFISPQGCDHLFLAPSPVVLSRSRLISVG